MNEQQYTWIERNARMRSVVRQGGHGRLASAKLARIRQELSVGKPVPRSIAALPILRPEDVSRLVRGFTRRADYHARAVEAWERLISAEIAAISKVKMFEDGYLIITVANPVASYSLRRRARQLRSDLAKTLPGLRHIRFVVRGYDRDTGGTEGDA